VEEHNARVSLLKAFSFRSQLTGRLGLRLLLWAACGNVASAGLPAAGATTAPDTENYTIRAWQTQDGLPEQTVQAVAQTQDGYLWIGTTGGLLRFDGSQFVTYERGNTPAFHENSVFCLMTARDGSLWIGTEGGGLIRLREGKFDRLSAPDGLSDGFVRTVMEDRQGVVWVGTDNGLFQLPNAQAARVTRVDNAAGLAALAVHAIAEDKAGTVWVGGSRLVAVSPGAGSVGERAKDYALKGEYSETRVKSILPAQDGTIWVGTVSGLQRMAPGSRSFERFKGIESTVRTLRETETGTEAHQVGEARSRKALWIGTIGQGAFVLSNGQLTAAPSPSLLPSRTVLTIFEDAEGNVWMGTQAGMLRYSRSPVHLVPLPNASDSDFETVSRDRDNSLWVASTHLSHVVNGVATPYVFPELHGARVRNVFRDQNGGLWIGTDGRGLFWLKPGQKTSPKTSPNSSPAAVHQFTTENGLVNNFVRGVMQARNGDIWIATDEGVSRISNGALRSFRMADGLAYFSVRCLVEDRQGQIWIGTDRGLSHLQGDRFVQDAATEGLREEKVWAIHQTGSGAVWFGTRDGGLYRFLNGTLSHFTTDQGLASNSVYSILEDGHGRFWIGGARGVDSIAIAELEGPDLSIHSYLSQRFFGVSEAGGLSPLYGGTQPAGAITADGSVWFPTTKGPVYFLTGDVDRSAVPKVVVNQIAADGRRVPVRNEVRLAADNASLEIDFGSILLGPQDAVQFQYRLEGFDKDWRYAGLRRAADYTNLPAGSYTFRVRAFQGGSGEQTERSLIVFKHEYFYRTWWFLTCCVAAVALIVWGTHRLRLQRVQTAFQAVLEERARLAREMHDTLIQGCAGVSMLLEACASAEDGEVQIELVDFARTQLAASIDEARQAVWDLRGTQSSDFAETVRKLAERTELGSNIPVTCVVDGEAYPFSSRAMHEITMVSREAIYNALLHANPTQIWVHASFGAEQFSLLVKDNGSGFEVSRIRPEGHYGLVGIHERIQRLGGTVEVKSAAGQGTEISIALPRASVDLEMGRESHPPVDREHNDESRDRVEEPMRS
jgi:ligand-binding sensor domain-containing protein/signal transduction histidine kinase